MSKLKKVLVIMIVIAVLVGGIFLWMYLRNWPMRFHAELDAFFGAENWECIDTETKESIMYDVPVRNSLGSYEDVPGHYANWYIEFENRNGQPEVWYITNHTMKINHDTYWLLSSKRCTARQALTQELMDISFAAAGQEIYDKIVRQVLSEEEAACLRVSIGYHGGNPEPGFYDRLRKEPWFTANTVTAGDYLACDLHDFYIDIFAYDYRLEDLSPEQQENVLDSLPRLTKLLLDTYGEEATFEIYLTSEQKVKYTDGVRVGYYD